MTISFTEIPNMDATRDIPVEQDETPIDGTCIVCGVPLVYSGRGKRPKYCPDHRRQAPRSSSGVRGTGTTTAKNEALAIQAAAALVGINGLVEMIMRMAQMPVTADTMAQAKEGFREQAQNALINDPDLCKSIIAGGGMSAKLALFIAYGMLGSVVVPVGVQEWKANHPREETE